MTPAQAALLAMAQAWLERDARISSAWLAGSLGRGGGDAFSDVDLLLTTAGDPAALAAEYAAALPQALDTVLVKLNFGRIVSAVTPGWERLDLLCLAEPELARYPAASLRGLFTRGPMPPDGTAAAPARPLEAAPADAAGRTRLADAIDEFLRITGLAPVAFGRGEYLVAMEGAWLLRRLLVDLLLDANGVTQAQRGGALALNPYLTPEQRAALEALPPLAAEPARIAAHQRAIAQLFFPVARRLAAAREVPWPQALEAAAKRRFATVAGVASDEAW